MLSHTSTAGTEHLEGPPAPGGEMHGVGLQGGLEDRSRAVGIAAGAHGGTSQGIHPQQQGLK